MSEIKEAAYYILDSINVLAQPYLKNKLVKKFWDWFFVAHGKQVILNTNDAVLKIAMQGGYDKLKVIFDKKSLAAELRTASKINDPSITKKLMMMPDFQKSLEYEIDELL